MVVLVNPVEICAIFNAAIGDRQCGSHRGTGILGYKAVNGIRRIDIQRVLLRKTVPLIDPERAVAFVTVTKYAWHRLAPVALRMVNAVMLARDICRNNECNQSVTSIQAKNAIYPEVR